MAMTTWLQMVSDAEIEELRRKPGSINQLDKPAAETFRTHYECSINYFVIGDAYPGSDQELAPILCGVDSVSTSTLENGAFGVTSSERVAALAALLAEVDLAAIRAAVEGADFGALIEEDVDDAEILQEADNPAEELCNEVQELVEFYAAAAGKGRGIAAWTS